MGALTGDPDLPGPPTTSSRPFSSVRSMASAMSLICIDKDLNGVLFDVSEHGWG